MRPVRPAAKTQVGAVEQSFMGELQNLEKKNWLCTKYKIMINMRGSSWQAATNCKQLVPVLPSSLLQVDTVHRKGS